MSTNKYAVHQKSRKRRYVATMPDKRTFQADTMEELERMLDPYREDQRIIENE